MGGVWVGTVAGTQTSGTSENGYSIFASGTDENGNAAVNEDGTAIPGDSVFTRTMTVETEGGVKIGLFGLTVAGLPSLYLLKSTILYFLLLPPP